MQLQKEDGMEKVVYLISLFCYNKNYDFIIKEGSRGMKVLLLALNSKYIHTNLAVRYLTEYVKTLGITGMDFVEYTINHRLPFVVDEVYRQKPDVLVISCYIWNIEMVKDFVDEYKKVCPGVRIILGGPEVSYNSQQVLEENPSVEMVLTGEGEIAFAELMQHLQGKRTLQEVFSLTYRCETGAIQSTKPAPPISMDDLPFPYPDFSGLENKILYFETIRGCPFHCSYCLSSVTGGVRYLSMEKACQRLQIFLDHKVPQVKLVDRTFNCSKKHAMDIWKYLAEHDNGITNFHFELTAHLIDREMLDFLSTVRKGLFQFEIGVQSTNPTTIQEIHRSTDTARLLEICRELDSYQNIHLHLDLIAGLPGEGLESFGKGFDEVMEIRPQQMQLGFLKVLKGSYMAEHAEEYGLVYSRKAPFQVIRTKWLDYNEMILLKDMEEMVETYYNSGRFAMELEWIVQKESSLFQFFLDFGRYYVEKGYHLSSHSPEAQHTILKEFYVNRWGEDDSELTLLQDLCLYDICVRSKPKKLPPWVDNQINVSHKEEIREYFQQEGLRQMEKLYHIQYFRHNILSKDGLQHPEECAFLFNYGQKDLLGNAKVTKIVGNNGII